VQDPVVRNIVIIGEAANWIQIASHEFVSRHAETPWAAMRGMQSKMIHEYFDLDWDVVWKTVQNELPSLKRQIEVLLPTTHNLPMSRFHSCMPEDSYDLRRPDQLASNH